MKLLGFLGLVAAVATCVETKDTSTTSSTLSSVSSVSTNAFTGSSYHYVSISGQSTVVTSPTASSSVAASSKNTTSTSSGKHSTSTKNSVTNLVGSTKSSSASTTGSTTSSAAAATNTVPCNGYPEFCNRKYSNITQVCAHNSAFVVANNAASNQELPVITQLEDGVRMIQGETHYVNSTIMNCHSTCELLDVGPWEDELALVGRWLRENPYEVVTWLVVNSDLVSVEKYLPAIKASGISDLLYEPAYVPQHRDQWPTLGEMILSGKRLVMFMDYNANQSAVPYILDEFTHMWETPFSPTDASFPCSQQRPPGLSAKAAKKNYMYLANHNLNTAVDLTALLGDSTSSADSQILIPNTARINRTNGLYDTFGQMGLMTEKCTEQWDLPPNFLLVDYYNRGDPYQGSVFEVAAKANGVKYNKASCCGSSVSAAAPALQRSALGTLVAALLVAIAATAWAA